MSSLTLRTYLTRYDRNTGLLTFAALINVARIDFASCTVPDYDISAAYSHDTSSAAEDIYGSTIARMGKTDAADESHTIDVTMDNGEHMCIPCDPTDAMCMQWGRAKANNQMVIEEPTVPRYAFRICAREDKQGFFIKAAGYDARHNLFLPTGCKRVGANDFTTSNHLMVVGGATVDSVVLTPETIGVITIKGHVYDFKCQTLLAERRYLQAGDVVVVGSVAFVVGV